MSTEAVATEYYESSRLAKYPFEPYWPQQKLRICVTGVSLSVSIHANSYQICPGAGIESANGCRQATFARASSSLVDLAVLANDRLCGCAGRRVHRLSSIEKAEI